MKSKFLQLKDSWGYLLLISIEDISYIYQRDNDSAHIFLKTGYDLDVKATFSEISNKLKLHFEE